MKTETKKEGTRQREREGKTDKSHKARKWFCFLAPVIPDEIDFHASRDLPLSSCSHFFHLYYKLAHKMNHLHLTTSMADGYPLIGKALRDQQVSGRYRRTDWSGKIRKRSWQMMMEETEGSNGDNHEGKTIQMKVGKNVGVWLGH